MTTNTTEVAALVNRMRPGQPIAPQNPDRLPLKLGQIPVPPKLEQRHNLMIGTPGSGKTQAIVTGIFDPVRERGEPAIILDHSGEFLQRYYDEGLDQIFNPFDSRSVKWTVFNELRFIYDFDRLACGIIPDIEGENKDWQIGAQQFVSNTLQALWHRGESERTNVRLVWYLTQAPMRNPRDPSDPDTLQGLLHGSTSGRMFEPGAEKQLSITLGIISRYLKPFTYIEDGDFSITQFVERLESGMTPGWLFLSYSDSSYAAIIDNP